MYNNHHYHYNSDDHYYYCAHDYLNESVVNKLSSKMCLMQ